MQYQIFNQDADKQPNERYIESAMKAVILSAIAVCLLIALTEYHSGFNIGVGDGKIDPHTDCPGLKQCHWYILEPGKGFKFESWNFIEGYVNGWCSVNKPHTGFESDVADFDCDKGPTSASWYESGGLYPRVYDPWGRLIPTIQPAD